MILTPRRSNSGLILAMYPSSVVHTGVKSLGCENSTAHESPIQSWKCTEPSVVSASKSGAVSPICRAITPPSPAQPASAVLTAAPAEDLQEEQEDVEDVEEDPGRDRDRRIHVRAAQPVEVEDRVGAEQDQAENGVD